MLRHLPALALSALLLTSSLLLVSCDDAAPSDAETFLVDAAIARQNGDIEEAIRLLEAAREQEPSNASVRVALASARLAEADVDLLDVDRAALFLGDYTTPPNNGGATCPLTDHPEATPFSLGGFEGYDALFAKRDVIGVVFDLLQGDGAGVPPVVPPALRAISFCGGIVDGELVYDDEGALAEMRALDLNDQEIVTALAVNAIARFFEGYFFLAEDLDPLVDWYQIPRGNRAYVVACTADLVALQAEARTAVEDLSEAMTSIDLRSRLIGEADAPTADLVDQVIEAFEYVSFWLIPYCNN